MKGTLDIVGGNVIDGIADKPRKSCSLRVQDGRTDRLDQGRQHRHVALELLILWHGRVASDARKREAVMHDTFDDLGVREALDPPVGWKPEPNCGQTWCWKASGCSPPRK